MENTITKGGMVKDSVHLNKETIGEILLNDLKGIIYDWENVEYENELCELCNELIQLIDKGLISFGNDRETDKRLFHTIIPDMELKWLCNSFGVFQDKGDYWSDIHPNDIGIDSTVLEDLMIFYYDLSDVIMDKIQNN